MNDDWRIRVDVAEEHAEGVLERLGVDLGSEARELAARLHGEVEAGGELVYEVVPQNPFVIFGGLGGTGTPI